jgi:hypothetical protein
MKRFVVYSIVPILALFFLPGSRWADEGMWLLDSINKLPMTEMKSHGLQLNPEQIYSENGPSLKDAIILLGGGTASFISSEGLVLTNHHVAFSGIQSISSVQADYLKNGFWAKSLSEEIQTSYTAQMVVNMRDVTTELLSALSDTMSALQRDTAVRARSAEIEKSAKGTTDYTCRIVEMYSGVKYYLFTYEAFQDVRLVYAPPAAIGNFGGEVDNWMWPRHTGDFSILRVYAGPGNKPAKFSRENAPYRPKVFLPISAEGYQEGSFAMIMGFPGRTFRYREAPAVELSRDVTLPTTIDLYRTRIDAITTSQGNNRATQIQYASRLRSLENTYKNYLGTLDGMKRAGLLRTKEDEQRQFAAYLKSSPRLEARYGSLLNDLSAANTELKKYSQKSLLLMNITTGVDLVRIASRLRRDAGIVASAAEPPQFTDGRERVPTQEFVAITFKNLNLTVDARILEALILKGLDFPPEQQLQTLREIVGNRTGQDRERRVHEFIEDLYEDTELSTPAGCGKLAAEGPDDVSDDPFVKFVSKIEEEQKPITSANSRINGNLGRLREKFAEAWLGWKGGTVTYPDANRSLRFTYGTVKSLVPRDAVSYRYYTTLDGVMDKEQSEEPFIVPAKLKELWQKKDFGRYADAKDGSMHVAFLADLDITGGNSGSPVINGKGELIGCAFDGNWEAVVGDYYFQEKYNRTISVDARYVLFVLDKFSGAENILRELVIK